MSDAQQKTSWSNNPNAPKIPYELYLKEKSTFAGIFIASILYGTLIVVFFQCMVALLNPVTRRGEGIKWGLVSHTAIMFWCATITTGVNQHLISNSFIDNREFPGFGGALPPGPVGYLLIARPAALSIIPNLASLVSYWLADSILLYRCYIIYSMNIWAIALPCLAYLGTVVTGIMIIVAQARGLDVADISLSHLSITVSLNVSLTLMIVIRLVLHGRSIRAATGSRAGISGLYKVIAITFIESSAHYTVASLLLIGLWAAGSGAAEIFTPIHAEIQVIAPLLIIKRIANRSALTSDTIVTGTTGSFHESTGGDHLLTHPSSSDMLVRYA